ncbi:MAG: YhbY family RNA-binding protein [Burkholderiaceae bacterium]|jgi:RNA-binding protein
MPKLEITPQQRSELRAAAHPLKPVVLIGEKGLSDAVLKEIEVHLNAHGLIKVRVAGDDRPARVALYDTLCETLSCAPVHHLGKTLIIYRPSEKAQKFSKPAVPEPTRAVRKPSEPHTPKKQAAQGVTLTRKSEKARRSGPTDAPEAAAPKVRRSLAGSARPAPHGIPRRSGSALSLRAGARRGRR